MEDPLRDLVIARSLVASRGGRQVLGPLDLLLRRGEGLLVAGSNGSGKTTLLLVLLGLIAPSAGSVRVLGQPLGSRGWKRKRRGVGYVNQESVQTTLPISAWEVAEIGVAGSREPRAERRERVEAAMRSAGCLHLAGRAYRTLSGGEKQRVAVARCLAQGAELLLLDEPTASLDPQAKRELSELLASFVAGGLGILTVTHELTCLAATGWPVLSLEAGRVAPGGADS